MLHVPPTGVPPVALMDLTGRQLNEAIGCMRGTRGAFAIPLLQGALAGDYQFAFAMPGGRLPTKIFHPGRPSTVVVLSGDPDAGAPTPPPAAFPQAVRFVRWADAAVLHAAGGAPEHYSWIAEVARSTRRLLVVETGSAAELAWVSLLRDETRRRAREGRVLPVTVLSAQVAGGFHPMREAAE